MWRKILLALATAFLVLQFFRGAPPEVRADNPADLIQTAGVDNAMATLLRGACYDCHSMETHYPWYSYITPVSWLVLDHIREGREELNFSEWDNLEKRRKIRKLKDIAEEVSEGEMPLPSYTPMHASARLTDTQRRQMADWAEELAVKTMGE